MTALSNALAERIAVPLVARDSQQLLDRLVAIAIEEPASCAVVRAALRRRETQFAAFTHDGIMLPHARTDAVMSVTLAAARLEEPLALETRDGRPVDLAFLVVSPDDRPGEHLELMRQLAERLRNRAVVQALRTVADARAFGEALRAVRAA